MGLQEKLLNTNSAIYLLVLIWWIVCLWIDEPETGTPAIATTQTPETAIANETGDA
jgi:hypothetical protein